MTEGQIRNYIKMTEGQNALAFQKLYKKSLKVKMCQHFRNYIKIDRRSNVLAFQKLYKKQIFNLKKKTEGQNVLAFQKLYKNSFLILKKIKSYKIDFFKNK